MGGELEIKFKEVRTAQEVLRNSVKNLSKEREMRERDLINRIEHKTDKVKFNEVVESLEQFVTNEEFQKVTQNIIPKMSDFE